MKIIEDWSDSDRNRYGREIVIGRHNLLETGLFSDDALADVLNRHPNNLIDLQYIPDVPDDPNFPGAHKTVDFSGYDGATMLKAAKSDSKIWINVRDAMSHLPEYAEIMDQIYAELEAATGKNRDRRNCRIGILISSAKASTPFHADPTMTHLMHIRGHKRIWVYPTSEKVMPERTYEDILLSTLVEDIPYQPEFDEQAILAPADLMGGELVTWPHRAPHRVENVTYCVSLTMEFSTRASAFTNSAMFANGILRRKYGLNPKFENASKVEKLSKAMVGFSMRKLGANKTFRPKDLVKYQLDPNSDSFIHEVETPYERVH